MCTENSKHTFFGIPVRKWLSKWLQLVLTGEKYLLFYIHVKQLFILKLCMNTDVNSKRATVICVYHNVHQFLYKPFQCFLLSSKKKSLLRHVGYPSWQSHRGVLLYERVINKSRVHGRNMPRFLGLQRREDATVWFNARTFRVINTTVYNKTEIHAQIESKWNWKIKVKLKGWRIWK